MSGKRLLYHPESESYVFTNEEEDLNNIELVDVTDNSSHCVSYIRHCINNIRGWSEDLENILAMLDKPLEDVESKGFAVQLDNGEVVHIETEETVFEQPKESCACCTFRSCNDKATLVCTKYGNQRPPDDIIENGCPGFEFDDIPF